MMTKTKTGIKSSAAGMPRSAAAAAKDRRFMMVVAQRITQATLSRGVLYALIEINSAWAEGQGHS